METRRAGTPPSTVGFDASLVVVLLVTGRNDRAIARRPLAKTDAFTAPPRLGVPRGLAPLSPAVLTAGRALVRRRPAVRRRDTATAIRLRRVVGAVRISRAVLENAARHRERVSRPSVVVGPVLV